MLPLIRRNWRFFAAVTVAALLLRLLFVFRFPLVQGDTLVYATIARNWLATHVFGLGDPGSVHPTLIRLPGYPAFLGAVFAIFGHDNFRAVMLLHTVFDLVTCFLVAALAFKLAPANERFAKLAFLIAAVCPFTANYVATGLTETLSIFFTTASLLLAIIGLQQQRLRPWILCGFSTACAILLRPDGGILLGSIGLYLLWLTFDTTRSQATHLRFRNLTFAFVLALVSLAPLIPWTIRNWRTFHVFQPLVTFQATDPGESFAAGWDRWLRTWMIDYSSMEDVAFKAASEPIDLADIPPRAFDSDAERQRVTALLQTYNESTDFTPDLDAQFAEIARERIHAHPIRYYVLLPGARLTAMWFRPRTEMLPLDVHWWRFADDPHDSTISSLLGLLNLLLVGTAVAGACRAFRPPTRLPYAGLLVTFIVTRSLFMMFAGVAEPRYVLECYPVVILFAANCLSTPRSTSSKQKQSPRRG